LNDESPTSGIGFAVVSAASAKKSTSEEKITVEPVDEKALEK
jgi:hypothetical protein